MNENNANTIRVALSRISLALAVNLAPENINYLTPDYVARLLARIDHHINSVNKAAFGAAATPITYTFKGKEHVVGEERASPSVENND